MKFVLTCDCCRGCPTKVSIRHSTSLSPSVPATDDSVRALLLIGVSRMQTSLRRKHRDRVVRRGLGMLIESDFYATEAGRQHFADQLTSIRYCVQETCNFDVIFSYLTCGNYDFRYDMAKSLRPKRSVKIAMQHELMMYGICQKEGLGLDKAVEEVKFRMSRYGVTPNMMVIPPCAKLDLN